MYESITGTLGSRYFIQLARSRAVIVQRRKCPILSKLDKSEKYKSPEVKFGLSSVRSASLEFGQGEVLGGSSRAFLY
jgi:hypothetical protein